MEYMNVKEAAKKWDLPERRVTALCRAGRIIGARKIGKLWMIPSSAPKPLDGRTKEYAEQARPVHSYIVSPTFPRYTEEGAHMKAVNAFEKTYKYLPPYTAFTPYRVCPIGAHSDHNLGKITGFAIDKGIHIAYGPKQNGVVEIQSLQFPKRAQWHVNSTPENKQGDWADHLEEPPLLCITAIP